MIELRPILPTLAENPEFAASPDCVETLQMSIDYYQTIGYHPPWICYYAYLDHSLVGSAGFKGRPVGNKIEIAYGTLPACQHQGIGTAICRRLVLLAQATDPGVIITARTLPEENYSVKILRKNHFRLLGEIWDKDDGRVWEWLYEKQ